MNITRFEPWSFFDVLQRDIDRVAGRHVPAMGQRDNGDSVADWVPAVDIVEEQDRFVLRADVPGVRAEDIDVNMENGVLPSVLAAGGCQRRRDFGEKRQRNS